MYTLAKVIYNLQQQPNTSLIEKYTWCSLGYCLATPLPPPPSLEKKIELFY